VGQDGGHDAYGLLLAGTVTVVRSIRLGVVLLGFRLWIFENARIGVSYRFGDGLTGVRVNFGFPF
jgi:hypothetical protein